MGEAVKVEVTTVSGGETLHFAGSGTVERTKSALTLRYHLLMDDGGSSHFTLRLGAQHAFVESQSYRLLLSTAHITAMTLHQGVASVRLDVVTRRIEAELHGAQGTVCLHYCAYLPPADTAAQALMEIQSTLTFYPQGDTP